MVLRPSKKVQPIRIPEQFLPHFCDRSIPLRVREFAAMVISEVLSRQRVEMYSRVARYVLSERHYAPFLRLMSKCEAVGRDHGYCPASLQGHRARCKAWILTAKQRETGCHHIVVRVSFSVRSRLAKGLAKYCYDSWSLGISELFLDTVTLPTLSNTEINAICETTGKNSEYVLSTYETAKTRLAAGDISPRLGGDGRTYHVLTCLPKGLRSRCFVGGEKMVEVDAHALHPAIMASVFAVGSERAELIEMLQSGDFYGAMGSRLGISPDGLKKNFLANVLYAFESKTRMAALFREHFPVTATNLANFRDRGEIIFDGWKYEGGRKWRKRTRFGQRALSRLFCRIEGQIFRTAQRRLFSKYDITTAPLHDSLLCAEPDAETVKSVVMQTLSAVLGFEVGTKMEGGGSPSTPNGPARRPTRAHQRQHAMVTHGPESVNQPVARGTVRAVPVASILRLKGVPQVLAWVEQGMVPIDVAESFVALYDIQAQKEVCEHGYAALLALTHSQ